MTVFTLCFAATSSGAFAFDLSSVGLIKKKCASSDTFKASSPERQNMVLSGYIDCKAIGGSYEYSIRFMHVKLSDMAAASGKTLHGNWVGMAAYDMDGTSANWLYDEARPIGFAIKEHQRAVFGNVKFVVPKSTVDSASHVAFYVTANGFAFVIEFR